MPDENILPLDMPAVEPLPPAPLERPKQGWLLARGWVPSRAPLLVNYCYYSANIRYDRSTPDGNAQFARDRDMHEYVLKATTRALDLTPSVSEDYKALRSNTTKMLELVDGEDISGAIPIDVLMTPPTVI